MFTFSELKPYERYTPKCIIQKILEDKLQSEKNLHLNEPIIFPTRIVFTISDDDVDMVIFDQGWSVKFTQKGTPSKPIIEAEFIGVPFESLMMAGVKK